VEQRFKVVEKELGLKSGDLWRMDILIEVI
jgi:hypothetical protein